MLTYLQGISRLDISMAIHQSACYLSNPQLSHKRAIIRIGRYLIDIKDKDLICKVDKTKSLECYADADFASGWSLDDSLNPENVLLRTGFIIINTSIPIF